MGRRARRARKGVEAGVIEFAAHARGATSYTQEDRMSDEIDNAVRAWTAELLAEAELGRADVAELEDHLRDTIATLRDQGLPTARAVAEAAHRLGDPRAIAREHARVRGAFGAKLSRARGWSVIALLVPMMVNGFAHLFEVPMHMQFELFAGVVLVAALAARRTWARPILLGGIAFWMLGAAVSLVAFPHLSPIWLVIHAGLVAFLAPWRRGEITAAGASLALSVWAFAAATLALGFWITTPTGGQLIAPGAVPAVLGAMIATCGGVLRARWAALASAVAAVGLGFAALQLNALTMRMATAAPAFFHAMMIALVASGAVAAAIAAVLSFRTARSMLGTLRAIAQ